MAAAEFSIDAWSAQDLKSGSQQPVSVSLPEQVFCWTRAPASQDGGYLYGEASGLRSLIQDPEELVGSDLNAGYPDTFIRKQDPDDAVPVDVIVYGATFGGVPIERATVVTFRNNLNKLLLTPLQPNDPWVIDAAWVGSTLFLDIVKLPEQRQGGGDQDRFTYYGYKFEALCTGAGPDQPVDCTGEFAIMVQVRLGRHHVLMAAETDAWDAPPDDLAADPEAEYVGYVELKTYVIPQGDRAVERHYREKYPRWWVQSYLAGVPTLVLGGRDRSGTLRKIHRLPVTRLPALAQDAGFGFDAFRLLRFGDAALDWMCATASSQPDEQWRFTYLPAQRVIQAELVEEGSLPARVAAALRQPDLVAEADSPAAED